MNVGDRFFTVAATDVRVNRTALNGTGANQSHLNHQVVEVPGLEPGQRAHLGSGFHLEDTYGVGPAQHAVDSVLLIQGGQVNLGTVVLGHQIDGVVQG